MEMVAHMRKYVISEELLTDIELRLGSFYGSDIIRSHTLKDELGKKRNRIYELEDELDEAAKNLAGAERYIDRMHELFEKQHVEHENDIEELETSILALGIQAAEAEDRAEQENHKRLQYLMRR